MYMLIGLPSFGPNCSALCQTKPLSGRQRDHLARWWEGLVGGSTMSGKGQEKGEPPSIPAMLGDEMLSAHRWHWKPEGSEREGGTIDDLAGEAHV